MTNLNNDWIVVSFDRTVYPLHSIMHIRFRLRKLIKNKLIDLQIHDQDHKILFHKKINPHKHKILARDKEGFLYQINVKMKGDNWKIGKTYTVIAKYGDNKISDSMTIEKRKPLVQSDKSVYIIGSDIIITVIAPDFDRDNDKQEYVGDKPDGKLTIWTKGGKLTKYKLKETGDSTGIFQGIIGLIPVYQIKKNKKVRNKARGKGPFNGYLPASRGDIIKDKFESKSETSHLMMFTSNFGASVELDQKTYVPTDRVYLTIVAPDYNYNSNKIDTIGNHIDSKITISSSIGKLTNYRLIETGKDTGIFTGELSLTGFQKMNSLFRKKGKFGITAGKGPLNGKLACLDNDKIIVTFDTGTEKFTQEASISWNIGEISWERANYESYSKGVVTVVDPDMNLNPKKIDSFKIHVWSDSDKNGINVPVYETGISSGIFKGIINFVMASRGNTLKVSEEDNVTAEYIDKTLPPPHILGNELRIQAFTSIGAPPRISPTKRFSVTDFMLLDAKNKKLTKATLSQEVKIHSTITNLQRKSQRFVVLLRVLDNKKVLSHISSISGGLQAGKSFSALLPWKPTEIGTFLIQLFVWKSTDNPEPLSPKSEMIVRVTKNNFY